MHRLLASLIIALIPLSAAARNIEAQRSLGTWVYDAPASPLGKETILGVKLGMPLEEATRILKSKGYNVEEDEEGPFVGNASDAGLNVTVTTPPYIYSRTLTKKTQDGGMTIVEEFKLYPASTTAENQIFSLSRDIIYYNNNSKFTKDDVISALKERFGEPSIPIRSRKKSIVADSFDTLIWSYKDGVSTPEPDPRFSNLLRFSYSGTISEVLEALVVCAPNDSVLSVLIQFADYKLARLATEQSKKIDDEASSVLREEIGKPKPAPSYQPKF